MVVNGGETMEFVTKLLHAFSPQSDAFFIYVGDISDRRVCAVDHH
jgi:hypothetical protein